MQQTGSDTFFVIFIPPVTKRHGSKTVARGKVNEGGVWAVVAGAEGIHRATVDAVLGNRGKPLGTDGGASPPIPPISQEPPRLAHVNQKCNVNNVGACPNVGAAIIEHGRVGPRGAQVKVGRAMRICAKPTQELHPADKCITLVVP